MENLVLFFRNKSEYERAKDFFENVSDFYAHEMNDEFKSLTFAEDGDLDTLETCITQELEDNGFVGYWFGCE